MSPAYKVTNFVSMTIRSRIAPTPSGFLHIGNGVNFVLTWLLTRSENGIVRLRIDDLDAPRINNEYIEDVFRTLDWLGIDWDEGPQTPAEHLRSFSQQIRINRYTELIEQLEETDTLFRCKCSRKDIQDQTTDGQYPGTCRGKEMPLDDDTAIRIITPCPCIVHAGDMLAGDIEVDLYRVMRDPVIKRRDGIPAYHIASLADDIDFGINLIVRGADLIPSTAAQLFIAGILNARQFLTTRFYHHPLLYDKLGNKLSKSAGSDSIRFWRERGAKAEEFYSMISRMLKASEEAVSARELLQLFAEGKIELPVVQK
jgi:glutamyl/glutaminyl-tRNA synthetase